MKTKAGTELPIMDIKGKPYLQVAYRILWMREDRPGWGIHTEPKEITETYAIFKASIIDENGKIIATAHKFENSKGFPDFIEKSETGAVGRALGLSGFGTQFCADELDEKDRLADSPMQPAKKVAAVVVEKKKSSYTPDERPTAQDGTNINNNMFTFGGLKNHTWGTGKATPDAMIRFMDDYEDPANTFWGKKVPRKREHAEEIERAKFWLETYAQMEPEDKKEFMTEKDIPF